MREKRRQRQTLGRNVVKFFRQGLTSRISRASLVVVFSCCISVWLSDSAPKGVKAVADVLFESAESIAIISAAILFFLEIPDRRKRDHYEAWQVINSSVQQSGSGGRIQAMQDLNQDGVELEGIYAPLADLSAINLSEGRLTRANFAGAQLDLATLRDAYLVDANLSEANLVKADLTRSELWSAELENANLQEANLEDANLSKANLTNAYIWKGKLKRADLASAILNNATLWAADMQGTDMRKAELEGTNFYQAQLQGAKLNEAVMKNANLKEANLEGASLCDINLEGVNFQSANFKGTMLRGSNLSKAQNLTEQQLSEAVLYDVVLPMHIKLNPDRDRQKFNSNK